MSDKLYLKSNVIAEPLWNQWYAWSFLIQPVTAAYINEHHLRILESYVEAPELHAMAAKKSALRGGAFLDNAEGVVAAQALIEQTKSRLGKHRQLVQAIKKLDTLLQQEANGCSVEPFYEQVDEILKGYIEIVYDLNNQPKIRFIEPLLYTSEFYDESLQSFSFMESSADGRAFVLSSPRFTNDNGVQISLPFRSAAWDELFAMRWRGVSESQLDTWIAHVAGDLSLPQKTLFKRFFTPHQPQEHADRDYQGEGVRVRYFGHATVLLQTRQVTVMTDPIISYPFDNDGKRYTLNDLPEKIDYVLLTHNHQDHVMFETLLQMRHKIGTIVVPRCSGGDLQDPSLRLTLNAIGFERVIELAELQTINIACGGITGLPFLGEHGDLDVRSKLAFCVQLNDKRFLFAADSNNLENRLYEKIRQMVGNIDYLFIGMECAGAPMSWLYGPLYTKPISYKNSQARRLNGSGFERAFNIVRNFSPQGAYIYAMGAEPWLTFISSISYEEDSVPLLESDRFVAACRNRGIDAKRLYGSDEMELL
ncbi:MBL fold metallo-hydrolase [Photorhabdus temperata subsp. temperata]